MSQMPKIKDIFHPTFSEQYELALWEGEKRFGSECKHAHVKAGRCIECLRKVVAK